MVELREYQKGIVSAEIERKNVLIVAPMGAGKTLSTLTALAALIYREGLKNVLIIAPKRVAKSVWAREACDYDMGLNIKHCDRALDIKLHLLTPEPHHICVCSVTRIEEIPHGCWDMVVIDESTMFGNKTSLRSKEARRICNKVPRRVLLTGTPIHGGYEKLFHQIFLLDGGASAGRTLTAFRERYMRVKYQVNGVVTVYEMKQESVAQLRSDIDHLVYVVRENAKVPPMLYKRVYVDLPPQRSKEYAQFERDSIMEFELEQGRTLDLSKPKMLMAFSASSRGMKLRQLASGCVYVDDGNKTYSVTHTEKMEAIKELVSEAERGVLVAYQFRSEYEELKKAFPKARRLENDIDIVDWNNGKIDIALVHPASVGHGLNLQFGGNIAVWYSLTYDAELYAQLNKRLHRSGQVDPVSIVHLVTRGTIDEKIMKVLESKELNAKNFTL